MQSLSSAHAAIAARYPGESSARQPVHTVYGGGHLFKHDTAHKLGALAKKALAEYAPDAKTFAGAIGVPAALADVVYARVVAKLEREPVEDFRIDFEDGYGTRADAEEDGHVALAAREVAEGKRQGTLPPFIGIRIKCFSRELAARSVRTLDIFLTTLAKELNGDLPQNFVVTFPKIQHVDQVRVFIAQLAAIERRVGLGRVPIEIMVEQPQTIFLPDGRAALPIIHDACDGRLLGAHFGTYDYTASMGITAAHQHMLHPACDFAKNMMQVAFAGTGVMLSDGATNVMPVGNRATVHDAWRLHASHVRHSLETGFYQGWDLHPAQLPTRYAAVFSFFLESKDAATERLKNFVEKAAQATLVGDVFDDAATGQGLLNFFLRGLTCGALTEQEALATGLTVEELRSKSFVKVLANRKSR
ncbi:MAG TPA: phosphoenolpyruvate kinase [Polyangiaceae bacterium]|jgi:citrate lyase beta subunit